MTQLGLFGECDAVAVEPTPAPCPTPIGPDVMEQWLARVVIWAAESVERDVPARGNLLEHPDVVARREQVLKHARFWHGEAQQAGGYCYQGVYAVALERLAREMERDPEYFAKQPANRTEFQWLREREEG